MALIAAAMPGLDPLRVGQPGGGGRQQCVGVGGRRQQTHCRWGSLGGYYGRRGGLQVGAAAAGMRRQQVLCIFRGGGG